MLLALFGSVFFAPTKAQASCGDYVMIGGKAHGGMLHAPTPGAKNESDQNSADGRKVPRPCHGPSCSNESRGPIVPPVRITTTVDRWASLTSDRTPVTSDHFALLTEDPAMGSEILGWSIFRPPR